jgi:hypothetical protein
MSKIARYGKKTLAQDQGPKVRLPQGLADTGTLMDPGLMSMGQEAKASAARDISRQGLSMAGSLSGVAEGLADAGRSMASISRLGASVGNLGQTIMDLNQDTMLNENSAKLTQELLDKVAELKEKPDGYMSASGEIQTFVEDLQEEYGKGLGPAWLNKLRAHASNVGIRAQSDIQSWQLGIEIDRAKGGLDLLEESELRSYAAAKSDDARKNRIKIFEDALKKAVAKGLLKNHEKEDRLNTFKQAADKAHAQADIMIDPVKALKNLNQPKEHYKSLVPLQRQALKAAAIKAGKVVKKSRDRQAVDAAYSKLTSLGPSELVLEKARDPKYLKKIGHGLDPTQQKKLIERVEFDIKSTREARDRGHKDQTEQTYAAIDQAQKDKNWRAWTEAIDRLPAKDRAAERERMRKAQDSGTPGGRLSMEAAILCGTIETNEQILDMRRKGLISWEDYDKGKTLLKEHRKGQGKANNVNAAIALAKKVFKKKIEKRDITPSQIRLMIVSRMKASGVKHAWDDQVPNIAKTLFEQLATTSGIKEAQEFYRSVTGSQGATVIEFINSSPKKYLYDSFLEGQLNLSPVERKRVYNKLEDMGLNRFRASNDQKLEALARMRHGDKAWFYAESLLDQLKELEPKTDTSIDQISRVAASKALQESISSRIGVLTVGGKVAKPPQTKEPDTSHINRGSYLDEDYSDSREEAEEPNPAKATGKVPPPPEEDHSQAETSMMVAGLDGPVPELRGPAAKVSDSADWAARQLADELNYYTPFERARERALYESLDSYGTAEAAAANDPAFSRAREAAQADIDQVRRGLRLQAKGQTRAEAPGGGPAYQEAGQTEASAQSAAGQASQARGGADVAPLPRIDADAAMRAINQVAGLLGVSLPPRQRKAGIIPPPPAKRVIKAQGLAPDQKVVMDVLGQVANLLGVPLPAHAAGSSDQGAKKHPMGQQDIEQTPQKKTGVVPTVPGQETSRIQGKVPPVPTVAAKPQTAAPAPAPAPKPAPKPASAPTGSAAPARPLPKGFKNPYQKMIQEESTAMGFDPDLTTAMVRKESSFRPGAVGKRGEIGLMQVLPETAADRGKYNLKDPRQQVKAGLAQLKWTREYIEKHISKLSGKVEPVLAGYNAGVGNLEKAFKKGGVNNWKKHIPKSTAKYVDTVMKFYADLVKGGEPTPLETLQKALKVRVDNILGSKTWTAVQVRLKARGHDPGKLDGRYGPKTRTAIKSFQTKSGLSATGRLNQKTMRALAEAK